MIKFPKEFVLMGTDNDGVRHRYSVEKNDGFKGVFIKFMEELGFDGAAIKKQFEEHHFDDETEEEVYKTLKVSEIVDVCKYYKNNEYELDVFYGKDKIILVIRTNQKKERVRRAKLLDDLEPKSTWKEFPPKPLKTKHIVRTT